AVGVVEALGAAADTTLAAPAIGRGRAAAALRRGGPPSACSRRRGRLVLATRRSESDNERGRKRQAGEARHRFSLRTTSARDCPRKYPSVRHQDTEWRRWDMH